ncbi:MAG: dTDP-4-dehydrorhamnose 3,5-epimerase family protein [Chloroflexota bacterium]|nr:dTDP-4-dehydrorhamnose 3,5-epimerase family protein [Chloroflexota bacterium]
MEETPLGPGDIREDVRGNVSRQEYGGQSHIEGVQFLPLQTFVEDGGTFTELGRLAKGALAGLAGFEVRQVNCSLMAAGAIKAWHFHFNQEDVWFVPPSQALVVGLWDVREDSPTTGNTMRFVLGRGRSQLLYIPRGVAHGAANLGANDTFLFYFVNQQFDAQDPDERRLPYDALGKDFWEIRPG